MGAGGFQLAAQMVGILSTTLYIGALGTVAFGGVLLLQKKKICRFRRDFWQEIAGFAPSVNEREKQYRASFQLRKKARAKPLGLGDLPPASPMLSPVPESKLPEPSYHLEIAVETLHPTEMSPDRVSHIRSPSRSSIQRLSDVNNPLVLSLPVVRLSDDSAVSPMSEERKRRQASVSLAEMTRLIGLDTSGKSSAKIEFGAIRQLLIEEEFGIQIASDLHMEMWTRQRFYPLQYLLEHVVEKAAPVLALLGDISVCGDIDGFEDYKNFVTFHSKQYSQVLLLAGNHEFYCDPESPVSVKRIKEDIHQFAASLHNVHFLDNTMIEINGVLIFGTTLWSEIDNFAAEMIQRSVNDFEMIFVNDENTDALRKLQVADVVKWHKQAVMHLKEAARQAARARKKLIVLSHHAPTFQGSSNPKDENSPLGSAFCTNLDVLMDYNGESETSSIHTWAFGHTHHCSDQRINRVRVISNQYGYSGVLNNDYNERCVFTVQ